MIGEKIRLIRISKGYSQEYMAFMLNISQGTYSKLEKDSIEITIQRLLSIAEILEVNITELLPDSKMGKFLAINPLIKILTTVKISFNKLLFTLNPFKKKQQIQQLQDH
jgi:transcriptional regulator with XRE-family HTH domain